MVYAPGGVSSFWVFVGFRFSVRSWSKCCFRVCYKTSAVNTVNLSVMLSAKCHRLLNLKQKSLIWPHWSACCVCLCVLPPAILFVLYPLSLFHPPSFVQLPFAPTCQVVSVKQHNRAHSHTNVLCSAFQRSRMMLILLFRNYSVNLSRFSL